MPLQFKRTRHDFPFSLLKIASHTAKIWQSSVESKCFLSIRPDKASCSHLGKGLLFFIGIAVIFCGYSLWNSSKLETKELLLEDVAQ